MSLARAVPSFRAVPRTSSKDLPCPGPFRLPIERRESGGFEFVERGGALSRAAYLLGGFILTLGLLGTLAVIFFRDEPGFKDPKDIAAAIACVALGSACLAYGYFTKRTTRILRYDGGTGTVRLIRLRSQHEIDVLVVPVDQCELRIHPIEHSSRIGWWNGFAAVIHLRSGLRREHFALAALKSEPLIRAYIDELPHQLRSLDAGPGPTVRDAAVTMRLQSRRTRRASRGQCPNCGYDLAPLLSHADRCPECGWDGQTSGRP